MASAERMAEAETIALSLTDAEAQGLCNLITAHMSADVHEAAGIKGIHLALRDLGFEAFRIFGVTSSGGTLTTMEGAAPKE